LDQKDVQVELANGVLAIAGEKKDGNRGERDRVFSERRYGGFEGSGSALTHRNQQQIAKAGACAPALIARSR
jgi:HSP20 family molecular chaperone IbpA